MKTKKNMKKKTNKSRMNKSIKDIFNIKGKSVGKLN